MFSGMPMSLRNSTSTRMTSWEATAWLGSGWNSKLRVKRWSRMRSHSDNRTSSTHTWQRQMHGFLICGTTWTKINGSYCPDSDPFSTFQFCWPKHRYSFCSESVSVNVMSCPGTTWGVQIHLSKKNIRRQRMTGVLHRSRKFGPQVSYII